MQGKVILETSVIAAIFSEDASERERVPLLTLDRELHEKLKKKRNVKLI